MNEGVHLHVASGCSARYGASHPADLVRRATERGIGTLALTDRDTVAGVVRFARAAASAGSASSSASTSRWSPCLQRARPPRPDTDAGAGRRARARTSASGDAAGAACPGVGAAVPSGVRRARGCGGRSAGGVLGDARRACGGRPDGAARADAGAGTCARGWAARPCRSAARALARGRRGEPAAGVRVVGAAPIVDVGLRLAHDLLRHLCQHHAVEFHLQGNRLRPP